MDKSRTVPSRNVLLVANFAPETGYAWWLMENFWLVIENMAASWGGKCVLIYPCDGQLPVHIDRSNIQVEVHDLRDRSLPSLLRLRRLLRRYEITTVYLTDQRYFDWLYCLIRLWGVKSIVLHDHVPGERPRPGSLRLILKRLVHQVRILSCDCYIGVSEFIARRFVETGGIPEERTRFVHNGIPERSIECQDRLVLRRSLGARPDDVVVINVGRAHNYKGIPFMIEVAAALKEEGSGNIRYVHVGDGPHLSSFRSQASELGVADLFYFAGRRSDVQHLLNAADIAFHTSRGEAFSLAILEYMAAGLAVLAPDHCGNPEAIEHGINGYLYQPTHLIDAVEKLKILIHNNSLRSIIGAAAKDTVRSRFSLNQCNDRFREVFLPVFSLSRQQLASPEAARIV
jgi:glycosyltransferase involved in cell wall biosynthesis